jgi:tetratricopeptide (TPR) repeat protein
LHDVTVVYDGAMLINAGRLAGSVAVVVVLAGSVSAAQTPGAASSEIQALYQRGERALAEQRYADAEQAYEQMRTLQPAVAEVHARLGLIYFQQGRYADAVPSLQRALQLKPALPNVSSLLAMALSEIGRHEDALPGLEKAFHQSTDTALRRMAGLHLQRSYTDLDRDREAVAVALELSRLYPDDPEVLYHTGRLFGNYAYLQTVKLARIAPDSVWLHQAAGEANESQGQLDEAAAEYRRVLVLAPNRPGLHFRLGRVLLARSRQARGDAVAEAEALTEFGLELQTDPTNADAAYEIGELMRKTGQFDKAIASFKQAVASYPSFEEALVGLGRALAATGDAAGALPHLQKAITLNPQDEVAFYQLAQTHRMLGHDAEQQKALAEFERLRSHKGTQASVVPAGPSTVTPQQIEPAGRQK